MKTTAMFALVIACAAIASADVKDGTFDGDYQMALSDKINVGRSLSGSNTGDVDAGWFYHSNGMAHNEAGYAERTTANAAAARGVAQVWTDGFLTEQVLKFDYSAAVGGYGFFLLGMDLASGELPQPGTTSEILTKGDANEPWYTAGTTYETGGVYTFTLIDEGTIVAPAEAGTYTSANLDMGSHLYYAIGIYVEGPGATIDNVSIAEPTSGPVVLVGDANNDGVVSADDFAAVQTNFGNTGAADGLLPGDANDDGVVSADDFAAIQTNFGNVLGAAVEADPIPEPATITLLSVCALAGFRGRGRRV